ncbi:alanine racemase [Myxococcota bacterium]|nr:alanine racemase [Myxococcota bacterium]
MAIRHTALTVDLGAIRHNLAVIRELVGERPVCAVIKANAYGHGLERVGLTLADAGVDWLAVALVEEGLALRSAGIQTPILVLGAAIRDGFEQIIEENLTPVIFRLDHLKGLGAAAGGKPHSFHLKIDTGMARLGLSLDELDEFLDLLQSYPNLKLQGLMTHFANADLADLDFNTHQLKLFEQARLHLAKRGHTPPLLHLSNSAAVLSFSDAYQTLVRPGLAIYGLDPRAARGTQDLRVAMRWTTRPIHIKTVAKGVRVSYGGRWTAPKESQIATLPLGYADGYPRQLSNKAQVLVRGQRAPVVGSICMDLCMVDVSHIPGVTLDDEVVLLGSQGDDSICPRELAAWADTISYEIICGVGMRVPRRYVEKVQNEDV